MAQSSNPNLKLFFGQYTNMLSNRSDSTACDSTVKECLIPLLELFKAGAENWFLGNVLAQFVELPESLHLPLQVAGVSLAHMIGVHLRNYLARDMYGLNPALLAELLNIKVHQARGLLSGHCKINDQNHLAWKTDYVPFGEDEVILPAAINTIKGKLLCSAEEIKRLVNAGVHTPVAALAVSVLEAALIGYLLDLAGFGEVGNELGRYVLGGTAGFIATKVTSYFAGCASNLWHTYVGNTLSPLNDSLLDNPNP